MARMNESICNDDKFDIFEPVLQKINGTVINPPDEKISQYKSAFIDFFHHFKTNLAKYDPVINSYKKTDFMGSFLDNLSIGNTYKEFDGAILIKLPKNHYDIVETQPGHVGIIFNIPSNIDSAMAAVYGKWLDEQNYILAGKFRSWCESIITISTNSLPSVGLSKIIRSASGNYSFTMSKTGPSFTLHVKKIEVEDCIEFDVDVHVCIEFEEDWSNSFNNLKRRIRKHEWLASPIGIERNWRYTFPHDECLILKNHLYMKSTLRLIKKLRDKYQMKYLTNYHIKTVFLHEATDQSYEYWQNSLSKLLICSIDLLKRKMESGRIPFYWDERLDLLADLDEGKKFDCKNKLNTIMRNINSYVSDETPDLISNVFLNEMEKNDMRERAMAVCRMNRQIVEDDSDDDTHYNRFSGGNSSGYAVPRQMVQQEPKEKPGIDGATIALGVGAAAAAALGGFLLFRSLNNSNNKKN